MNGLKYAQAVSEVSVLYLGRTAANPGKFILCVCLIMTLMVLPLTTNYLIIFLMSKPKTAFK